MSSQSRVRPSTSTDAKDHIRHTIDRSIIREFRDTYHPNQLLSYLGLPGESLRDILSWREFLGRCTAIENSTTSDILELNVLLNRLEGIVEMRHGDIDDMLINTNTADTLRWPYEIINLDYYGGLVNISRSASAARGRKISRRLEAIKSIFDRSDQLTPFILLLTLNLRDDDGSELDNLVSQQESDLVHTGSVGVEECIATHKNLGHAGLLKIYVPIFLSNYATAYSLIFHAPILYHGTRPMLHFAIECLPYEGLGAGRVLTTTDRIGLVNLPLMTLHSGDQLRRINLGSIRQG